MRKFAFSNAFYDEEAVSTSSKMAQLQASQSPGFIFVNVSGAKGDEKRKHMQKVVRSAATSYSHRVQPRGTSKSDIPLKVVRCGHSTRATDTSRIKASEDSKIVQHGRTVVRKVRANMANISRKRDSPTHKEQWSDMPHRYKERSLSPGPVSLWISDPSLMDASIPDPFDSYPVKYRKWYGQLINFWYHVTFARSTRVLKATREDINGYSIWSRRQELQEPALYYTALYLASGIPVAEGLFPVQAALWLRLKTVEAMKEALDDPKRATSTPVILAVGRIALHEHIYRSRELAHNVHRPAQRRMINMRGGLANMNLPAMTVQLIVWTDSLLSAEAGTAPYFADVPRQIAIQSYSPQEAMQVTNHCSPQRKHHPGYDGAIVAQVPKDE